MVLSLKCHFSSSPQSHLALTILQATCLKCRHEYPGNFIEADVLAKRVPYCKLCQNMLPKPVKKKKTKKSNVWTGGDDTETESEDEVAKGVIKVTPTS